jgi:hypothetical protein
MICESNSQQEKNILSIHTKNSFNSERPALRIAAVILFERYEQKDKSGKPDPAFSRGNAQNQLNNRQFTPNLKKRGGFGYKGVE